MPVPEWTFLTNHTQALLYIVAHPDTRQRDLAAALDVTERTANAIVADLTVAGYVVKERDGRRNRYHVREQLPLTDATNAVLQETNAGRDGTVGDLIRVLLDPSQSDRS